MVTRKRKRSILDRKDGTMALLRMIYTDKQILQLYSNFKKRHKKRKYDG